MQDHFAQQSENNLMKEHSNKGLQCLSKEKIKISISEKFLPSVGLLGFFFPVKVLGCILNKKKAHLENNYCFHCKTTSDLL